MTGSDSSGEGAGTGSGRSSDSGAGLAVAWGVGFTAEGAVGVGDSDIILGIWKPSFRRESDHNKIAPIALKATKMPTNSSNPKGVFVERGSG